jgi:3',5'-cyclic AMP phosphodiesterase CpdA
MKIVHLSDIHIWRYTWDPRRLWGVRALGMAELILGRARRFHLGRIQAVVSRVLELKPDHILITGDMTTTALPSEFREASRVLDPLLEEAGRVTVVPGNHDRTTLRSFNTRRFEGTFGAFMPSAVFPWQRWLDDQTAILGLDPTRPHFAPRGALPADQLERARELTADPERRPRRLIVACHYPVTAPVRYQRELLHKRLINDREIIAWLSGIGPHLYCCGHVHAAWAFRPRSLPNQLCLNAGAPLMSDPKGLRYPGFLEIDLDDSSVSVTHQAWVDPLWQSVPMLPRTPLEALLEPLTAAEAR